MHITGTHFNYYYVCKRKLWLFVNGISMEHTSDVVFEGKLLHETSYPQRSERYSELEIDGIKIDFYDARNKVIHEIKKSNKIETAHQWQVKYYIYVLETNGIDEVTGLLEYPLLRQTLKVILTDNERKEIVAIQKNIVSIIETDVCPDVINSNICNSCSYYELCYVRESEI